MHPPVPEPNDGTSRACKLAWPKLRQPSISERGSPLHGEPFRGYLRASVIVPIATRLFRTSSLATALGFSTSIALAQDTAAAGALFEKGLVE